MSAIYSNNANQIAALKELYDNPTDYMKDLVYKKNPFLALCPKDESPEGFQGKYIPVPIINATGQGRSGTFSYAQSNQTAPTVNSFFVYSVANYQLATLQNQFLLQSASNPGAFIEGAKYTNDAAIRNITNDLAHDLFSDGSGTRGQISAITSGVITLVDPNSVVQFELGMTLNSFSVSGTTATISTTGALGYVIGVDRTAGTVTVSATQGGSAGTPTNWSTSFPNLSVQGDTSFASGGLAAGTALKVSGLAAWIPTTAPGSTDSFWGVNRYQDPTRLGGVRFNGASESIEEALIDAMALLGREGADPEYCFINFSSYAALEKSLGAKVMYVDVKHQEADIAFEGIMLNGPYGRISVIPDRNVPSQTAYLLTLNTWRLRTTGKAPMILTYGMEGLEALRVGNADAVEIRWGYYGNLICNAPGWNGVVTLSQ